MNKKTFLNIWTAIHLFAVYAGINAILYLQRSPFTLPLFVEVQDDIVRGRASMAIFWTYIAGSAVICSALLGMVYLRRYAERGQGISSAPSMFGIQLQPRDGLSRTFQAFWLILCMALSAYGVGHAARIVLEAPLYECHAAKTSVGFNIREGHGIMNGMYPWTRGKDVRFDGCGRRSADEVDPLQRGVEYVPVVGDMLVAVIAVATFGTVIVFWVSWYARARVRTGTGTRTPKHSTAARADQTT